MPGDSLVHTPEQLDYLKACRDQLGEARIRQAEADWQDLIAQAQTAMQTGVDPTSATGQALARRWTALIQQFTGGDAGIQQSLHQLYQQAGVEAASQGVLDAAVMDYMGQSLAALEPSP